MATTHPRLTVTLKPEWMPELDEIKTWKFLNESRSEVIRYLIELGLEQWRITKNSPTAATVESR